MSKRRIWGFKEEVKPCGEAGKLRLMSDRGNISHVLAMRVESHPWFIILWEPLDTKAPGPNLTQPYCCYATTIIFYLRGYIVRPFSSVCGGPGNWYLNKGQGGKTRGIEFETWGKTETLLRCDSVVEFENQWYEVGCGKVIWKNNRWWMVHSARRDATRVKVHNGYKP